MASRSKQTPAAGQAGVASPALDTSYAKAKPVKLGRFRRVNLWLVGCGGTGSWLAPDVARVARMLQERHIQVSVTFADRDVVESTNISRQQFCAAEVGQNKAFCLASRYSRAWGVEITALQEWFTAETNVVGREARYDDRDTTVTVLIGCVDNAAGRQAIHAHLKGANYRRVDAEIPPSRLWWLDCGNADMSGQVVLGSMVEPGKLARAFALTDRCAALPAPSLIHPNLLVARPEERPGAKDRMSCEEMATANAQSLSVNKMTAAVAADYLINLLLTGTLKTYATYFELGARSMRSKYTTKEAVLAYAAQPEPDK